MFIDTGSLKDLAPLGAKHRKVLVDQPKHRDLQGEAKCAICCTSTLNSRMKNVK